MKDPRIKDFISTFKKPAQPLTVAQEIKRMDKEKDR